MIRTTHVTYQQTGMAVPNQAQFDTFWNWLESSAVEEMWSVDSTGAMSVTVNEETMIEILEDDMAKAYNDFDCYSIQDRETGENELYGLPYELCGTYTIVGVYNWKQELVDGERTYYFSQEF